MMRKRAVTVGLILMPVVMGGAVIANLASTTSSPANPPTEVLAPAAAEGDSHRISEQATREQEHSTVTPRSDDSEAEDSEETSLPSKPAQLESEDAAGEPMLADAERTWGPVHRLRRLAADASSRGASSSRPSPSAAPSANVGGSQGGTSPERSTSPGADRSDDPAPTLADLSTSESESPLDTTDSHDAGPHDSFSSDNSEGEGPVEDTGPLLSEETGPEHAFPDDEVPGQGKDAVRVPEPATLILFGLGLVACALVSRKMRA